MERESLETVQLRFKREVSTYFQAKISMAWERSHGEAQAERNGDVTREEDDQTPSAKQTGGMDERRTTDKTG